MQQRVFEKVNNKLMILILIMLILINLTLLIFYFKNLSVNIRIVQSNNKSFTDKSKYYSFPINKPLVKKTGSNVTGSKTYTFKAFIAGSSFFDNKYYQYVIPLKLSTSEKTTIFYLVLGNAEINIPVLIAKNGIVPGIQEWKYLNLKALQNYFVVNNPIIIDVDAISDEGVKYLQGASNCTSGPCLIGIKTYRELSVNTESLYKYINDNKLLNNKLYIGYPTGLVLYD